MNQGRGSAEFNVPSETTSTGRLTKVAILTLETLLLAVVLALEILVFFYRPRVVWPNILVFALILTTPLPWLMGIWSSPRAWKQTGATRAGNPLFGYCRVGSAYMPLLIALLLLLLGRVGHP